MGTNVGVRVTRDGTHVAVDLQVQPLPRRQRRARDGRLRLLGAVHRGRCRRVVVKLSVGRGLDVLLVPLVRRQLPRRSLHPNRLQLPAHRAQALVVARHPDCWLLLPSPLRETERDPRRRAESWHRCWRCYVLVLRRWPELRMDRRFIL